MLKFQHFCDRSPMEYYPNMVLNLIINPNRTNKKRRRKPGKINSFCEFYANNSIEISAIDVKPVHWNMLCFQRGSHIHGTYDRTHMFHVVL